MRQKIRKFLLLLSLILFPVTIYYVSPGQLMESAQKGYITASMFVFAAISFASLIFGRAYCGFLCPVGAIGEACFRINDNNPKGGKRYLVKYILWLGFMGGILFFLFKNGHLKYNIFYKMNKGVSVTTTKDYLTMFGAFTFFITVSLIFGKRAFCHYLCPTAVFQNIFIKIKETLHLPSLRLKKTENECVECRKCESVCPMGITIVNNIKNDKLYDPECIHCAECVDVCKNDAIKLSF